MRNIGRRTSLAVAVALVMGLAASACTDLLVEPKSSVTSGNVFTDASAYKSFLAKLYAGLAVSGQEGPSGDPDIQGIDEGFGQYVRGWWQMQELPTDEAVIGWGDTGLPEMNFGTWGDANQFVTATYYRIFFQIALANEFLRETTQSALSERGHQDIAEIPQYRAEARFLRALSYWHGLDFYRNIPLVTEDYEAGSPPPEQATPAQVYDFIVSELTDIRDDLPAVGAAEYGRADQGALAMLLAKVYMNAEVYGQGDHYSDAMTEVQRVIAGPYTLDDNYQDMFLADNNTSPEFIFAVPFDGTNTQSWGGTCFIIHAGIGGSMDPANFGVDAAWWGMRVTQQFVNLFEGGAGGPDGRALFYTTGQNLNVASYSNWNDGYAYTKYSNMTSGGVAGSHPTFPDTDFPMFRLADAYLMYAEINLRGGGGDANTALGYVNALRRRAYGHPGVAGPGDITLGEMTLPFILDERARELGWEGHRRNDLIRFGEFTGGNYIWAFKGGTAAGASTDSHLKLYPIPATELVSNPNLSQNAGYGG